MSRESSSPRTRYIFGTIVLLSASVVCGAVFTEGIKGALATKPSTAVIAVNNSEGNAQCQDGMARAQYSNILFAGCSGFF